MPNAADISKNVAKIIPMIPHIIEADEKLLEKVFKKATGASLEECGSINKALIQANYGQEKIKSLMQIIMSDMTPDEIAQGLIAIMKNLDTDAALAAEEVADAAATKAAAEQVESDAKMAKEMAKEMQEEMQEEDESKSGGGGAAAAVGDTTLPEPATTSAWGTRRTDMSTNDSADILARMKASAKVNRATQSATAAATAAAFPTCHTCGLRASTYNGVPNKFCSGCYKASKPTCQTCSAPVGINPYTDKHNPLCSACHKASKPTCTSDGCTATVGINPYTGKHNQFCSVCHKESIMVDNKYTTRSGLRRGKLLRDMKH